MQKAAYRIIDANMNRAREALRVMEEYARFTLNHKALTARAKAMRHDLCDTVSRLDAGRLLTSRDTPGDVGTEIQVERQWSRQSLEDCLTAAAKRLSEALRALSEVMQTHTPALAQEIEQLRYQSYTLEKDIIVTGLPHVRFQSVRLYVIVNGDDPEKALALTEQCARGGAECIQLRTKQLNDRDHLDLARRFVEICQAKDVISIINDRADIAIASDADGVHLGWEDLSVADVRAMQLSPLIIGRTTHNEKELAQACDEEPTYVALGPAFATPTKPDLQPAGLGYIRLGLQRLADTDVGHVVIGGINQDNVEQILELGVRTIAVSSGVTDQSNPAEACTILKDMIQDRVAAP